MPITNKKTKNDTMAKRIRSYYGNAYDSILAELDKADLNALLDFAKSNDVSKKTLKDIGGIVGNKTARNLGLLNSIENIFDDLDVRTGIWSQKAIKEAYLDGGNNALNMLKKVGYSDLKGDFTNVIHSDALEILANDTFEDLLKANNSLKSNVKATLRKGMKENIAQGIIKGSTIREQKEAIMKVFKEQGVGSIIKSNGVPMPIETYAEGVARTKIAEASTQALINTCNDNGQDLIINIASSSSCPKCRAINGKIVSLSGKSKIYPKAVMYENMFPIHFNCTDTTGAYIVDIEEEKEITDEDIAKLMDKLGADDYNPHVNVPIMDTKGLSKPPVIDNLMDGFNTLGKMVEKPVFNDISVNELGSIVSILHYGLKDTKIKPKEVSFMSTEVNKLENMPVKIEELEDGIKILILRNALKNNSNINFIYSFIYAKMTGLI